MEIFTLQFLWALFAIIVIDVVLGGENALVIAMASRGLPSELRKKAMLWGTFGAVAVRFLCVAILTYLLMVPGLRLIGGLLLVWIAWGLTKNSHDREVQSATTFWGAMGTIVMADAVMGLDNALAIAGAAGGSWTLIILGLLISVPIILFGSTVIARMIERWPGVIYGGAFILYLVAFKMIVAEPIIAEWLSPLEKIYRLSLPWLGAILMTAWQYYGTVIRRK